MYIGEERFMFLHPVSDTIYDVFYCTFMHVLSGLYRLVSRCGRGPWSCGLSVPCVPQRLVTKILHKPYSCVRHNQTINTSHYNHYVGVQQTGFYREHWKKLDVPVSRWRQLKMDVPVSIYRIQQVEGQKCTD